MKRPRNPATKIQLEITPELIELLEKVMPVGDGKPPVVVHAWRTRTGAFRKAVAEYPNGTRLAMSFNRQGEISSYRATFHMSVSADELKRRTAA